MKKQIKLLSFLTLLLSISIIYSSCSTVDDLLGGEENEEIYLNTSKFDPVAFEIITLWADVGLPEENEFFGTFGDIDVTAVQSQSGKLYFMIPDVEPGEYSLTLNIGESEGFTSFTVVASSIVDNPDEVIDNVITDVNESIQYLETLETQTGEQMGEQDKLLLSNTISEMNSIYSTLSSTEKQQVASFIATNPELFSEITSKGVQSGALLEEFKDFMSKNMIKVMLAGSTFYLSFTAPEPTGVTKFLALAAGAYLFKKVLDLKMHILNIYSESVVAEYTELNERSEFVFLNHEEIMFDVKVSYRTMYKEDMSTTIPLLQEVIGLIDNYINYWDKINGYITSFKSKFNISGGGLTGTPQRVSEIQTYTSKDVDGNGDLVEITNITNDNVKVAITGRDEGWIVARFSTCESEYQNFDFTYTYDDPMVEDKDYEALLVATEIIYHEITDPRDGKVYKTIDVGSQTWFAENVNYWGEDGTLGGCNERYDNNCELYGRYYSFYEAPEACPPGWHLPSDDDWKQFERFLGMPEDEVNTAYGNRGADQKLGSILKNCSGWGTDGNGNDANGINSIGFSAIPAGEIRYESSGEIYIGYGYEATFWTSLGYGSQYPDCVFREVGKHYEGILYDETMSHHAMPVRCVKD